MSQLSEIRKAQFGQVNHFSEGAAMLRKQVLIGAAACAALALAGFARADVSSQAANSTTPFSTSVLLADDATTGPTSAPAATAPAATTPTMLNGVLGGLPGYNDSGISVTGYVEGSWTYTAHTIGGNILTDRSFDTKAESLQFDAVDLNVSRATDITKPFDVGFTLEQLYGWDSAYIHSNGLYIVTPSKTASTGGGSTATIHPKAQYDLNQGNVVLSFGKVGNGLLVEGGKFDTLLGYEVIDAPTNPFYSHSYIFGEEPYTHTGLIGTYNLTDPSGPTPSTITGGITRGWDQATEDNNGSIDYTGQFKYAVTGKYAIVLSAITGDEFPSGPQDGWRTVLDANGTYNYSDQLTLGFNGMYAWEAQAGDAGAGGGTAQWYGFAGYASYKISDNFTFNARAEWFDDQDGAAPTQLAIGPNVATPNQYYEVTLGVSIKPMPSNPYLAGLTIRPEARWDYADHASFNEGTQHDQWTAAVEAYYSF
jgi:hypothetical protein